MALRPRATRMAEWWQAKTHAAFQKDPALESVLSWIRTIALEDDVFRVEEWRTSPRQQRFPFPSLPLSRPLPAEGPEAQARIRFVIRTGGRGAHEPPGFRPIFRLRSLEVYERDTPHGGHERPLRLGLSPEEGFFALTTARESIERFLRAPGSKAADVATSHARLTQRSVVAVALWTRGRVRGSVISPPGPALHATAQAARWACQDSRFGRLTHSELADTIVQVGFLHTPRVPLPFSEVMTCDAYADKAIFVSEGTRTGMYMPEVFNVVSHRTLRALTESLAREKAGLHGVGAGSLIEVCEVSDFVESADRSRALALDGPVAKIADPNPPLLARAFEAGRAACDWLAAIQNEDGSLPLFVRPKTGSSEGRDLTRMAATAEALVAFGVATGTGSAVDTARRVLAWLDRAPAAETSVGDLLLTLYRGKSATRLKDDEAVMHALRRAIERLDGANPGPLVLAQALSFFEGEAWRDPKVACRCEPLRVELSLRFERARQGDAAMSLAEWAELAVAFPEGSKTARDASEWLREKQLVSGAFPDTTSSDFVYTRGTGKVFEALALRPAESEGAIHRALAWLLSMQYRKDSAFFVPDEHRARVLGGLRHDYYSTDAWIDSAAHLLLGLARLSAV